MKQTRILMGMPITITIEDKHVNDEIFDTVYDYFSYIDEHYSPYKQTSEVSLINAGLPRSHWSDEMRAIMALCYQTTRDTNGYFDVKHNGHIDPSGLVKGWAINNAAMMLGEQGYQNFCLEGGGDFQVSGRPVASRQWRIGIRNPFQFSEVVKIVAVTTQGVATSGTYIRGQHIYNPHHLGTDITDVASLTVIGPNIYEADRFATAAFAMGRPGIGFIESLEDFEGYMIDNQKRATMTSGFSQYEYQETNT